MVDALDDFREWLEPLEKELVFNMMYERDSEQQLAALVVEGLPTTK